MHNASSDSTPARPRASWIALVTALAALAAYVTLHEDRGLLLTILFLAGLFLASLPLAYVRPHWALYLLVAIFPFGEMRGEAHWALGAALAGVVGCGYLTGKRSVKEVSTRLWPWLLAFLAANLLADLVSPYQREAFFGLARLLGGGFFLLVAVALLNRRTFIGAMPWLISGSITLSCLLALTGYIFNLAPFLERINVFKRASGGTVSPNMLALLIVIGVPFLVHFALHAERKGLRVLAHLCLLINLAAMVTTYSRGGLVVLVLLGIALLVVHLRRIRIARATIFVTWAAVFFVFTLLLTPALTTPRKANSAGENRAKAENKQLDYYWQRQESITDKGDFSVSRRFSYVLAARDAVLQRPLVGFGTMTFDEFYSDSEYSWLHARRGKGGKRRRAHNTYLEVVVGTGLVGLVLFLGMLTRAGENYRQAWAVIRREGDEATISLVESYGVSFVMLVLYLLIQSALLMPIFWLHLGLSEVARRDLADRTLAEA